MHISIRALEKLCKDATDGEWEVSFDAVVSNGSTKVVSNVVSNNGKTIATCAGNKDGVDAIFIAAAHNSLPNLISYIHKLESELDIMKSRVKECARLFHDYSEIVQRMEVIQNEMQSTAQAKKKKPRRRNRSCYR